MLLEELKEAPKAKRIKNEGKRGGVDLTFTNTPLREKKKRRGRKDPNIGLRNYNRKKTLKRTLKKPSITLKRRQRVLVYLRGEALLKPVKKCV